MFPTLKVRISGLDPDQNYLFCLEIVPFDDKRYRYVYHRLVKNILFELQLILDYKIREDIHIWQLVKNFQLPVDGGWSRGSSTEP